MNSPSLSTKQILAGLAVIIIGALITGTFSGLDFDDEVTLISCSAEASNGFFEASCSDMTTNSINNVGEGDTILFYDDSRLAPLSGAEANNPDLVSQIAKWELIHNTELIENQVFTEEDCSADPVYDPKVCTTGEDSIIEKYFEDEGLKSIDAVAERTDGNAGYTFSNSDQGELITRAGEVGTCSASYEMEIDNEIVSETDEGSIDVEGSHNGGCAVELSIGDRDSVEALHSVDFSFDFNELEPQFEDRDNIETDDSFEDNENVNESGDGGQESVNIFTAFKNWITGLFGGLL